MNILNGDVASGRHETRARQRVVALHCSGADSRQWRPLAAALDAPFELLAPDFYGTQSRPHWPGDHAFTLADEARPILEVLDGLEEKVHLVGHSYGGGVALHIARARPDAVASLTLYEPSAFHLLKAEGGARAPCYREIRQVAEACAEGLVNGDYRGGVAGFVDYWGGSGTWAALKPSLQEALLRWLPKAPLDFRALMQEPGELDDYRRLRFPVLILRGSLAPAPTATVATLLAGVLPDCTSEVLAGAGHMGPVTHAEQVAARIRDFLTSLPSRRRPQPAAARSAAIPLHANF
jgi:pimeloyl-ACP methyl ester carboxylesterase